MEVVIVVSIVLSAVTYLLDFCSNIAIVVRYGEHYFRLLGLERANRCSDVCRHQTSEFAGYFWGMAGVLFCSHTLNALIFKLKFHKDDPFRAAYFLPLIHLQRLLNLLWKTFGFQGVKNLRSSELNGLFSILGTSIEGMPILILQFSAYLVLVKASHALDDVSIIFKLSIVASLLSATYNGGSSVESIMITTETDFLARIKVALSAGFFTLFSSLSRCLTYVNVMVHMRDHFQHNKSTRSRAKYHPYDLIPVLFLASNIGCYWFFYWLFQSRKPLLQRLHDLKKCMASLVFAYMSIFIGPLYPMVSEAREMNEVGSSKFRIRLVVAGVINIIVDVAVMSLTYWMGTLADGYLIVSLVSAVGYLLCLWCFIRIDASLDAKILEPGQANGQALEHEDPATQNIDEKDFISETPKQVDEEALTKDTYQEGNASTDSLKSTQKPDGHTWNDEVEDRADLGTSNDKLEVKIDFVSDDAREDTSIDLSPR